MRPSSVVDGDGDFETFLRRIAKGTPIPLEQLRPTADWAVAEIDVLRGELEELPELQCPECDTVIRARMAGHELREAIKALVTAWDEGRFRVGATGDDLIRRVALASEATNP